MNNKKMNEDKNLEIIAEKIEERIINSDVDVAIEYLDTINDENGLLYDYTIYYNDEDFLITRFGDDVKDLIQSILYGDYVSDDDYVVIDRYGNLVSYTSKAIKDYIKELAYQMAEIFAEDYINDEGKFKGLPIYENL